MKDNSLALFFILSLVVPLQAHCTHTPHPIPRNPGTRNLLHQPFFPSAAPPPPPRQDQPFFREQAGLSPPPQTLAAVVTAPPPVGATRNATLSRAKKIAIAISSAILTLAMMAAVAVYLFKHCGDRPDESRKLVGNSIDQDSRLAPSAFLHIGTVEPSSRSFVDDFGSGANASPYRKLSSGRRSDRYRPSPELQPLPPLPRPVQPPMSSSDDEGSYNTDFYTPQGSSISNESPRSNHSCLKGYSPKSRFSASSPDKRPVMIPPPSQDDKAQSYIPFRFKFAPPPLPSDTAQLGLIDSEDRRNPNVPIPPPPPPPLPPPTPPPPPPQLTNLRKFRRGAMHKPSPISKQAINSQIITPKSNSATDEVNKSVDSSEIENDRDERNGSKPKLKPLHWDKVRATSDRATVWDQLNSNSFQLNEDAMESLFGCNSTNSASRKAVPPRREENRVLDPKKSQNIAILLRAMNVTIEEVSEALLDGNPEGLGPELLETLVKMAPTKEEEIKLKQYRGEITTLGSTERFLKAIIDIPFAFKRVEAMLYRANFDAEVAYLRKSFKTMEEASVELKNSRLFLKLLEAVLRAGNRMNDGTNRGDARAFKLDTLLKLVDVKGTDGKTTLLHFVVQEIIRSEEAASGFEAKPELNFKEDEFKKKGLQIVSGLSQELGNVKRAAGMDSNVLSSYVSKLEIGLNKLRLVLQHENRDRKDKFFYSMEEFLDEATKEIARIKAEERIATSMVREATQYFHGDAAKEEAHPLRIFMIVRDFLAILDCVCKDVRTMQQGHATIGAGRLFRMPK